MGKELFDYFKGNELAIDVWPSKYAEEGEVTPNDMHRRMAKEFARIEESYKNAPCTGHDSPELSEYGMKREFLSEEKIYNLFKDFKYIVPQGSVMSQLGAKSIGSLSNCFVIGQPYDSYGGIMYKDQEMVQLMKRRGGVGLDLTSLSPRGVPISNAAKTTTGAVSFANRYSNSTREVAQEGRRGALMLSIDILHPDSLLFIKMKRDLTQVTGANISVKIGNDFMEAVEKDADIVLRFPVTGDWWGIYSPGGDEALPYGELVPTTQGDIKFVKRIKAREHWEEIIKSAHSVAEPGILFWDNIINYSPDGVYPQYRAITTNPCGEIPMQEYDACRLIALNLFGFVDKPFTNEASFNFVKFYKYTYEAMRLSDDLIDLEIEHIGRILEKIRFDPEPYHIKEVEWSLWENVLNTAKNSRRTGLGFTGLGDALAALGYGYVSTSSSMIFKDIMQTKMIAELDCTIDMAKTRGPFEGWDRLKEYDADGVQQNDFYAMLAKEFPSQAQEMRKHGRRNVSWSTVAPTGTVSILTQTTSGIEPLFMGFYIRRKKVNPGENVKVDFVDLNGDSWQEYPVIHPKFRDWINITHYAKMHTLLLVEGRTIDTLTKEELEEIFKQSPWYGSTANDIDWVQRVEMQAIAQRYTSHSISSTINLPSTATEAEVSEIYLESWKRGLKGITVYRDGSRSGVLISEVEEPQFEYKDAVKRPKELLCHIYATSSAGQKYNVIVGMLDDKPYEIFITDYFTSETTLVIRKVRRGRYDLLKNGETYSESITSEMTEEQEAITRLVSTSLRHGANIKFIVEQLNKTSSDNMFTFTKSLSRVLKKYIPEGASSTVKCNDCSSDNVIFEEGCHKCLDCGSSACG